MALSSSSSVSSWRSSAGHHFPSTRLSRIEESKYEKHYHNTKLHYDEEQRRSCFITLLCIIATIGIWYILTSASTSTGTSRQYSYTMTTTMTTGNGDVPRHDHSHVHVHGLNSNDREGTDDQIIQSLRRNSRSSSIVSNQDYHGGLYQVPNGNGQGDNYHHGNVQDNQMQQIPIQGEAQAQVQVQIPPGKTIRKSREEQLDEAIQELKRYQETEEIREREVQHEIKAQLEHELNKS